jgi:ferredoxin
LPAGAARVPAYNPAEVAKTTACSLKANDDKEGIAMPATLRIRVDQDKCQGHSRCKSLAPELFDLDEYGNAHETGDGRVPEGLEDKAWLARANCPEIAVDVDEEAAR